MFAQIKKAVGGSVNNQAGTNVGSFIGRIINNLEKVVVDHNNTKPKKERKSDVPKPADLFTSNNVEPEKTDGKKEKKGKNSDSKETTKTDEVKTEVSTPATSTVIDDADGEKDSGGFKNVVRQQEQPQQRQDPLSINHMKDLETAVTAMEKFIAGGNTRVNMGSDLNVSMKAIEYIAVAVDHNLSPTFICLDYIEAGDVEGTSKVFSLEIKGEEDETGVFTIRKLLKGPQVVLVANHQLAKFKDAVIQNHNLWVNGGERADITADMIGGNIGTLTMLGGEEGMFA